MRILLIACLTILSFLQLNANDVHWTFPPTVLSTTSVNASNPQIATDANADLVAVWVENGFIKSSTKPVNMNWTTAVTLSNTGASSPRIVSDLNGNATAVWVENGVVKGASKPFNGNWGAAVSLSTGTGSSSPDLAVDFAGDVIAAWVKGSNIETSTKLFGANWQTRVAITSTGSALPHIAMGGSGSSTRAVLVWNGTSGSTNVVYATTKLISGAWSTKQIISDTTHQAGFTDVALDSSGNATAVWYKYDVSNALFSNVVAQAACLPAGGTWSPIVDLSEPGMRDPSTLITHVAYDNIGNAVAFWNNSFDGATFSFQSSVKPLRREWTAPIELTNGNIYAYSADIATSAWGDALAVYMFANGSSLSIQSSESNISGSTQNEWSIPITLSSGADNGYPHVAATLVGNVLNSGAIWVSFNGTHNTIAATTGTRTLVLPPSNLSVTQSSNGFGFFTEYFNTLSWQASSDPSVIGYNIFRNGVLIDQVGANVLQIQDHNATQNGSVTYGVAAVNIQQSQSKIVTINFP